MRNLSLDLLAATVVHINAGLIAEVVVDGPGRCRAGLDEVVASANNTLWTLRPDGDCSDRGSYGNRNYGATAVFGNGDGIGYSADVDSGHAV